MDRRSLKVGLNAIPNADPNEVLRFVKSETPLTPATTSPNSSEDEERNGSKLAHQLPLVGLVAVTVRLRPELAGVLKRTSLERQLAGKSPHTQQEIVESALDSWLRKNGYFG